MSKYNIFPPFYSSLTSIIIKDHLTTTLTSINNPRGSGAGQVEGKGILLPRGECCDQMALGEDVEWMEMPYASICTPSPPC